MKLGISGTRDGMTDAQRKSFQWVYDRYSVDEFHHGSCKGVDVEAARIAVHENGVPKCVCHPGPDGDPCRENSGCDDVVLSPKNHFDRNRDIANAVDVMTIIPKQSTWQKFGGSWMSHDYTVKIAKPVVIIWPDGKIQDEPAERVK